jgi:hypothetical protein
MEISIPLYAHNLTRYHSREDILDFILQLDLEISEVDFTTELIKKLKKSLLRDLSQSELDEL